MAPGTPESEANSKAAARPGGFALSLRSRRVSSSSTDPVSALSLLRETPPRGVPGNASTPGKSQELAGLCGSRSPFQSKGSREEKDKKNRLLSRRLATSSGSSTIRRTSSSTSASSTSDANALVPTAVGSEAVSRTSGDSVSSMLPFLTSLSSISGAEDDDGTERKKSEAASVAAGEAPDVLVPPEEPRAKASSPQSSLEGGDGLETKEEEREKRPADGARGSLSLHEERRKKAQGSGLEKPQSESLSRSNTMASNVPSKACMGGSDEDKRSLSRMGSGFSSFSVQEGNPVALRDGSGKIGASRQEEKSKTAEAGPLDPGSQLLDVATVSSTFATLSNEEGGAQETANRLASSGDSRQDPDSNVAVPTSPDTTSAFVKQSLSLGGPGKAKGEGAGVYWPSETRALSSPWRQSRKVRDPQGSALPACVSGTASPFSPADLGLFLDCLVVGEQAVRRAHARLDAVMRDVETAYSAVARAGAGFASLLGTAYDQLPGFAAGDLAVGTGGRSREGDRCGAGAAYRGRGDPGDNERLRQADEDWDGETRWSRRHDFGLQAVGLEAPQAGRDSEVEQMSGPPFFPRPHHPYWAESVSGADAGPGVGFLADADDRGCRLVDRGRETGESASLLLELAESLWSKGKASRQQGGDSDKRPWSSAETLELLRVFAREQTTCSRSPDRTESFDLAPHNKRRGRQVKRLGESCSGAASPSPELGAFLPPSAGGLRHWASEKGSSLAPDDCLKNRDRKRTGALGQRTESGETEEEASVFGRGARSENIGDAEAAVFDGPEEAVYRKKSGSTTSSQSGGTHRAEKWREHLGSLDRAADGMCGDRDSEEARDARETGSLEGGSVSREKKMQRKPGGSGEGTGAGEPVKATEESGDERKEGGNRDRSGSSQTDKKDLQTDYQKGSDGAGREGEEERILRFSASNSKEASRATSKSSLGEGERGTSGTPALSSGILTRGRAAACRQQQKPKECGDNEAPQEETHPESGTARGANGAEEENKKVGDSGETLARGIEEFLHAFKTRRTEAATLSDQGELSSAETLLPPSKRPKLAGTSGCRGLKTEEDAGDFEGRHQEGEDSARVGDFSQCPNLRFSDCAVAGEQQQVDSGADRPTHRLPPGSRVLASSAHWLSGDGGAASPRASPRSRPASFWDGYGAREGRDSEWRKETASFTSEERALIARFGHLLSPRDDSALSRRQADGLREDEGEGFGVSARGSPFPAGGRFLDLWGDNLSAGESTGPRCAGDAAGFSWARWSSEKGRRDLTGPRKQDLRGDYESPGLVGAKRKEDPEAGDDLSPVARASSLSEAFCPRDPAGSKLGASRQTGSSDCATTRSVDAVFNSASHAFLASQLRSSPDDALGQLLSRGAAESPLGCFREGVGRDSRWSSSSTNGPFGMQRGPGKPSEGLSGSLGAACSSPYWGAVSGTRGCPSRGSVGLSSRGARLPITTGSLQSCSLSPYDPSPGGGPRIGGGGPAPRCTLDAFEKDSFSQDGSFLSRSGNPSSLGGKLSMDSSLASHSLKEALLASGYNHLQGLGLKSEEKGKLRAFPGLEDTDLLFPSRGGGVCGGARRPSSRDSEEGSSSDGDLPEAAKTTWPGAVGPGAALAPRLHCVVPVGASRKHRTPGEAGENGDTRDGRGYVSDVPGVSYRSTPHSGWRFRWKDAETGKEYSRCFSVNKFGFERAKRKAERVAREMRQGRSIIISNHTRTKVYLAETNGSSGAEGSSGPVGGFACRASETPPGFSFLNPPFADCASSRAAAPSSGAGDSCVSSGVSASPGGAGALVGSSLLALRGPAQGPLSGSGDSGVGSSVGDSSGASLFFASGNADSAGASRDGSRSLFSGGPSPFFLSLQSPCTGGSGGEGRGSGDDAPEASFLLGASASPEDFGPKNEVLKASSDALDCVSNERHSQGSSLGASPQLPGDAFQAGPVTPAKAGGGLEGADTEKDGSLSSSVRGVIFEHSRGSWRGLVIDKDTGRQQVRRFSARKYGHLEARVRAERFCLEAQRFRENRDASSNSTSTDAGGNVKSPAFKDLASRQGSPVEASAGAAAPSLQESSRGDEGDPERAGSPSLSCLPQGPSSSCGGGNSRPQPLSSRGDSPGADAGGAGDEGSRERVTLALGVGGRRRTGREREASESSKTGDAASEGKLGEGEDRDEGNVAANGGVAQVKRDRDREERSDAQPTLGLDEMDTPDGHFGGEKKRDGDGRVREDATLSRRSKAASDGPSAAGSRTGGAENAV
ncbi:AP2 domain transcription factor AP2XI-2 [Toxoplasma gondii MAS]|uniref:AP2 domain transcription factor AP2XI-2 n=1 Tax=Toxoplasma gondii MAS TaxID=943118 RepID=A0A086QZL7_TOXGO|nr:AP2 domain transcription factor AP2XI-2 [Toxoplasma gondii MAS]